jgi:hypothetical protein
MKSISTILGALIIFSLNACSQDFKRVDNTATDNVKIQIAQKFTTDFFTSLKNGQYYQFHDEAIDALKSQLTKDNQRSMYDQIAGQFGNFKSLEYTEIWMQNSNPSIRILRFKSDFEKSIKKLEIRVVLNDSDKIAGFWIKPWSDMLK